MTLLQWIEKLIEEHTETNTVYTKEEFANSLPIICKLEHILIAYEYYIKRINKEL